MKNNKIFFLLLFVGFFHFLSGHSIAEPKCSGPTYGDDQTCGGLNVNCPLAKCQDVSFSEDGTKFQCCSTDADAPKRSPLVIGGIVLLLAALFIVLKKKTNLLGKAKKSQD